MTHTEEVKLQQYFQFWLGPGVTKRVKLKEDQEAILCDCLVCVGGIWLHIGFISLGCGIYEAKALPWLESTQKVKSFDKPKNT